MGSFWEERKWVGFAGWFKGVFEMWEVDGLKYSINKLKVYLE